MASAAPLSPPETPQMIQADVPSAANPVRGVPNPVREIPAVQTLRPAGKRPAGKRPSLRLAAAVHSSDNDDDDSSSEEEEDEIEPPHKRIKAVEEQPEDLDQDSETVKGEGDDDDDDDEDSLGDLSDGELNELIVPIESLPSSEPNAPDGAWICQQTGCGFEVPAAASADGRKAIHAHFRSHTNILARLVRSEGGPDKPVSHLLEKLQSLEQEKQNGH